MRLRAVLLPMLGIAWLSGCSGHTDADAGTDAADVVAPMDASNEAAADASPPEAGMDAARDGGADAMPPWLEPYTPSPRADFPAGFLWGSSTAAFQIEGQLHNTDWGQWNAMGRVVNNDQADDGPQSLANYMADIQTLTSTSQNAYRFGMEMARIFPTQQAWDTCRNAPAATFKTDCEAAADPQGLGYYRSVIAALRAANITPMVTVQHFSLPTYLSDLTMDWHTQGWMRDDIAAQMGTYAGFLAAEFGGDVDWWVTINEPLVYATVGYLDGRTPPGQQFQLDAILTVINHMIRAHAAMYEAIHAHDTTVASNTGPISPAPAAMVSIAHHLRKFYPTNPNRLDTQATARAEYLFNTLFLNAIVHGDLDADGDGMIDNGEIANDPTLAHHADYVGVNYYSLTTVTHSAGIPLLGGLPVADEVQRGLPKTDYGWDIHPRGMHDELVWTAAYGLPIVVTENGIADAADVNRPRFLVEHLAAMAHAIHDGANVLGYFHWSNVDNFEWTAGYCPHFGLFAVDRNDPARARTARGSASLYRSIAAGAGISDALIDGQPAYVSATTFCSTAANNGADASVVDP